MCETRDLIKKYGSKKVMSIVPHWNGGCGQRYQIYLNYEGLVREDSLKLSECMKNEVQTVINAVKNGFYIFNKNGFNLYTSNAITDTIEIFNLPATKSDGAPRLDCACILTENWYADFHPDGGGVDKWKYAKLDGLMYQWLISEVNENDREKGGVEVIADMHAKAIKRYIDSLT